MPIDTDQNADQYEFGEAGDEDGSSYPYTIDPSEDIAEFGLSIVGAEIAVQVTTTSGDQFTATVDSPAVFDRWAIDSVELQDPDGNTADVAWFWAGE